MNSQEWIASWNHFLKEHPILQLEGTPSSLIKPNETLSELACNESYWKDVQSLFPHPEHHINLNNGGVCSNALHVEQAYTAYYKLLNTSPSYFTWKIMETGRTIIKEGLASIIHAQANEIALFRNATEALNNAIFGIQLQAEDEVVACEQDYIKCVSSWKQRAQREGIHINWISIDGTESNEEIIQKYVDAFTSKTKVLHLTHIINWNGQILPIEAICKEAKQREISILIDAAHSFGVLETDVQKLDCDYMAVALHKWLSGPIAAGMLYVKKNRIAETYPLASALEPLSCSIAKFEEMSIQVLPNLLGLGHAITLHFQLGREEKESRLLYLRTHWTNALKELPKVKFKVPLNSIQCKAIASFTIDNMDPLEIEKKLFEQSKVHVSSFLWPNLSGVRITPNVYTPIKDIDCFIEAVQKLIE